MLTTGEVPQIVSVETFQLSQRLSGEDENDAARIAACLVAAQATVEMATRRPLGPRAVSFTVAAGRWRRWWLPVCPVVSIDEIVMTGTDTALDAGSVGLRAAGEEPALLLPEGFFADLDPGTELQISATVGYTAEAVPAGLLQAVQLVAREWYDAGLVLDGVAPVPLTFSIATLIGQWRYRRPRAFARTAHGRDRDGWGLYAEGDEEPALSTGWI